MYTNVCNELNMCMYRKYMYNLMYECALIEKDWKPFTIETLLLFLFMNKLN